MDSNTYKEFVHKVLTEAVGIAGADTLMNDNFPEDNGLDVPEDDNADLQEDIMTFVINNPYPTVEEMEGFADSIGVPFSDLLRQLFIHYTQLVIAYDQELGAISQDSIWIPDSEYDEESEEEPEPIFVVPAEEGNL